MSFLDHIIACNQHTAEKYIPFVIDGEQLGSILKSFSHELMRWPEVFSLDETAVTMSNSLDSAELKTNAIKPVLEQLHQDGIIDSWVGELYEVNRQYNEEPRFLMERAAVSFFGVRGYGVHVNGLVEKPDGIYIWIARRTKEKPFWPGMLDQIVAGGQPTGVGRLENVIKESAEEANIPLDIATTATLVSEIHYRNETRRGMHADTLFNYDLWLPDDFVPENTDGEVDEFILMSLEEMAHITNTTKEFKDNCNLVNIDLLLRRGLIDVSHSDYDEMVRQLYGAIY